MLQGYEEPRAERHGTRKSAARRQRTDDWSENSATRQASKAARELQPSEGSLGKDQQNGEDNIKGEQGDQGNDPGQINDKDAIKDMKRPKGDGAAPRRAQQR